MSYVSTRRGHAPKKHGDPLAPRQLEILRVVDDYTGKNGFPPSLREIADAVGVSSENGIRQQLKAMQVKGYVRQTYGVARSTVVTRLGRRALSDAVDLS